MLALSPCLLAEDADIREEALTKKTPRTMSQLVTKIDELNTRLVALEQSLLVSTYSPIWIHPAPVSPLMWMSYLPTKLTDKTDDSATNIKVRDDSRNRRSTPLNTNIMTLGNMNSNSLGSTATTGGAVSQTGGRSQNVVFGSMASTSWSKGSSSANTANLVTTSSLKFPFLFPFAGK